MKVKGTMTKTYAGERGIYRIDAEPELDLDVAREFYQAGAFRPADEALIPKLKETPTLAEKKKP